MGKFRGIHLRAVSTQFIILYSDFEKYIFRISTTYPRGQWVYPYTALKFGSRPMNFKCNLHSSPAFSELCSVLCWTVL